MDHWFDELTKQFAGGKPSRRNLMAAIGAVAAVAANGSSWSGALGATRSRVPQFPGAREPQPKTRAFGQCTATSKGIEYDHELTSTARASGRTAVLHAKRSIDEKGRRSYQEIILIDGKQQIKIGAVSSKTANTQTIECGDAFGFGSARLSSDDRGKTFRGKIDGLDIVPYAVGSRKKIQFAGGRAPKKRAQQSGLRDVVKAVYAKAAQDLRVCTSSIHAEASPPETMALGPYRAEHSHALRLAGKGPTYYDGYGGKGMTTVSTEAFFNQDCENCANNCGVSLFTGVVETVECFVSVWEAIFSFGLSELIGLGDCETVANYSQQQVDCANNCYKSSACNAVNCNLGTLGSCVHGQICMPGLPGLCCPSGYTIPCGPYGGFGPDGTCNFYSGFCGDYSALIESFCCPTADVCVYDTSSAYASWNGAGIFYCCPQPQICGRKENGTMRGTCCPAGSGCAVRFGAEKSALPACCASGDIRHGKCCPGLSTGRARVCGEHCCANGPCDSTGTNCAPLCLSGVACGATCCQYGCADAKTSTCKAEPKCAPGHSLCTSTDSAGAAALCCRNGRGCYSGKCCPKGATYCYNGAGVPGCWPNEQCKAQPTQAPPK
jgi:hypothetical protein